MPAEVPPFAIGSATWPGGAKVLEECGEVVQELGKLMAYPDSPHPDGTDVVADLLDELADLYAAVQYLLWANVDALDRERFDRRTRTGGEA